MKANTTHARVTWRVLLAALLLAISGAGSLTAQPPTPFSWEYAHYVNQCWHRGVKSIPVNICGGGGGYITLGVTGAICSAINYDVFVVRTNALGAVIWSNTYHVGLPGQNNAGGIVECADGSGFAITGTCTGADGIDQAFIMKLDCNGGVVWTQGYGIAGDLSRGNDIIETPALYGAAAGDLVICGDYFDYGGTEGLLDALIVRVNNLGIPIWGRIYTTNRHEILNSVTVADPVAPAQFGDIICAGTASSPGVPPSGGMDALIMRVDPATGFIGPAPQGMAIYTDPVYPGSNQVLTSVIEQMNGNIVAVGSHGGNDGVYLLQTTANPCNRITDQAIGTPNLSEGGKNVIELTVAYPRYGAAAGDLVIGGITEVANPPFVPQRDMVILGVNPATLAPLPGTGRRFGRNNSDELWGFVSEVPNANGNAQGFIVTGYSDGNMSGIGSIWDMYVVKTNAAGATGCHNPWTPVGSTPGMVLDVCPVPVVGEVIIQSVSASITAQGIGRQVCNSLIGKTNPGHGSGNDGMPGIETDPGRLLSYPNPVNAGESVGVRFSSGSKADLRVTIVDALGRTAATMTVSPVVSGTTFPVGTEGLTAGAYTIIVTDGTTTETSRIVVR